MGNVNDTLKKLGVPTEIIVDGGVASMARPDPYETAIEDRRMQQAMRVYEGMDAEAEARKAEHETTKLQAELAALETRARMMQLQQALGESSGAGGTMSVIVELMKLLHSDKAELATQNKELMGQILNIQQQATASVKAQIGQASERQGDAGRDAMSVASEQIAGLSALMQAIKTFMPQPTPETASAMRGAEEEIRILKAQKEIEFTSMKMREEHEARMADLRLREEDQRHRHTLDISKFEVDKRRTDGIANTLERFAPHAMAALSEVIKTRTTGGGAAVPAAAGMVAPDGTETIACPSGCGGSIEVRPGQTTTMCKTCKGWFGAVNTPDEAAS